MRVLLVTCLVTGGLMSVALAQDTRLVDCPTATLYGAGCRPPAPPPMDTTMMPPPVPLRFPREIMAPDTPPLFVDLANDPTPENADRFLEESAMRVLLATCVLAGGLVSTALAQDTRLVDCPTVTLYGGGCRPTVQTPMEATQVPTPVPLRFPREIMAPDTPPLFVDLVNDLTPENADRFLDWQEDLIATMQQVRQLLHERIQLRQQQRGR